MAKSKKVETKKKTKEEIIETNTKEAKKDMHIEIAPYLVIIVCVIITRIFIATPVMVNGSSMNPTLDNHNVMILYKLTKKFRGIRRFDIVVIDTDSGDLIKRVIGLPGDKIKYTVEENVDGSKTATLYVNGKKVKENFLADKYKNLTCSEHGEFDLCDKEITVEKDHYYVMGDNRGNSKDSRIVGSISKDDIRGTTKFRIWPLNKIGNVK